MGNSYAEKGVRLKSSINTMTEMCISSCFDLSKKLSDGQKW